MIKILDNKYRFESVKNTNNMKDRAKNTLVQGNIYIFPKIDGMYRGILYDKKKKTISLLSRNKVIIENIEKTEEENLKDDFIRTIIENKKNVYELFEKANNTYPKEDFTHILLSGEYLKNSLLKSYVEEAKNKFYIFDLEHIRENKGEDVNFRYAFTYNEYSEFVDNLVEKSKGNIIKLEPFTILKGKGCFESILPQLEELTHKNTLYIKEDDLEKGIRGEGIVVKNYEVYNKEKGNINSLKILHPSFKLKRNNKNNNKYIKKENKTKILVKELEKLNYETTVDKEVQKYLSEEGDIKENPNKFMGIVSYNSLVSFYEDNLLILLRNKKIKNFTMKEIEEEIRKIIREYI